MFMEELLFFIDFLQLFVESDYFYYFYKYTYLIEILFLINFIEKIPFTFSIFFLNYD